MAEQKAVEMLRGFVKKQQDRIRRKLAQRNSWKSENHKKFCEGSIDIPDPLVRMTGRIVIPTLDFLSEDQAEVRGEPEFEISQISATSFWHSSATADMLRGVLGYVDYRDVTTFLDVEWYERCTEFIRKLSLNELYLLQSYTYQGDRYLNALSNELLLSYHHEIVGCLPDHHIASKVDHPLLSVFALMVGRNVITMKTARWFFRPTKDGEWESYVRYLRLPDRVYAHLRLGPSGEACVEAARGYVKGGTSIQYPAYRALLMWMIKYVTDDALTDIVVPYYRSRVHSLLASAPAVRKEMTVYRGSSDDYYLRGKNSGIYENNAFVSTTIDPRAAVDFLSKERPSDGKGGTCCLSVIRLLPGVRCLPMWPLSTEQHELEVLLPRGVAYLVRNTRNEAMFRPPSSRNKGPLFASCPDASTEFRVKVSEVVVAPIRGRQIAYGTRDAPLVIPFDSLRRVKEAKGSGGSGRTYTAVRGKQSYVLKEVVKEVGRGSRTNRHGVYDVQLAVNEVLASRIYTEVYGVDALHLYLVVNRDARDMPRFMVASLAIDIDTCHPPTRDCADLLRNKINGALDPFLADCVLANWDFVVRGNVGIVKHLSSTKRPRAFRVDVGGSLLYRAMGGPKGTQFGPRPTEHDSFFEIRGEAPPLLENMRASQIPEMFRVLENARMDKLDSLRSRFEKDISEHVTDADDRKRAMDVIAAAIPLVARRHAYYIDNKIEVTKLLKARVK